MKSVNREKSNKKITHDSVKEFVDSNGKHWNIGAEFKSTNGRTNISAISIWPTETSTQLTRRVLLEIQLDKLFRNETPFAYVAKTSEQIGTSRSSAF